jgi:hypothetical protein
MESIPIPSSLVGALVFFGLLAMIMWLVIRETLRLVLKPVLIVVALALVAVWAGLLDETVIGTGLTWMGDQLIRGAGLAAGWTAEAFEKFSGGGDGA